MKKRSKSDEHGGISARTARSDEIDLWNRVTEDVTPLNPSKNKIMREPSQGKIKKQAQRINRNNYSMAEQRQSNDPELSHGKAPGLDKRTELRMRRGKVKLDARIDLHGLTQQEAHRSLIAFLTGSQEAGRKSVLVITGKGSRRYDDEDERGFVSESGVLRRAVPGWLNQPPLRSMVHAFSHAAPKDGGVGALYVMLKRKR